MCSSVLICFLGKGKQPLYIFYVNIFFIYEKERYM